MLRFEWIIVNPGAINIQCVGLTKENTDEVIRQLHDSGYKAGRSNIIENAIYFSNTAELGEPNLTQVGELLVVKGKEWIPLNIMEFNLSDYEIRNAIAGEYFSK